MQLRGEGKLLEAQRLLARTKYDLEMILEVGYCSGIENYSRHLDGRKPGEKPYTLIDYFPKDYLLIIDESHVTLPQIKAMYNGDQQRKEVLVDHGFRLPSAMDNRPLKYEEFEQMWNQVDLRLGHAGQDRAGEDRRRGRRAGDPPDGADRPGDRRPPRAGPGAAPAGAIKERVERGERVLVTTLTKRLAEDLSAYIQEAGIRGRYLHSEIQTLERVEILNDLRKGDFDVLVGINLLREGLDLPEVSMVAILDADKAGLPAQRDVADPDDRPGRAEREREGDPLRRHDHARDAEGDGRDDPPPRDPAEVQRRARHHAADDQEGDPHAASRAEVKARRTVQEAIHANDEQLDQTEIVKLLEEEMLEAAQNLEFERAAQLRDKINEMKGAPTIKSGNAFMRHRTPKRRRAEQREDLAAQDQRAAARRREDATSPSMQIGVARSCTVLRSASESDVIMNPFPDVRRAQGPDPARPARGPRRGDDVTSRLMVPEDQVGVGTLVQKEVGVVCGLPIVEMVCRAYDERLRVELIPGFHMEIIEGRFSDARTHAAAARPRADAVAAVGRAGDAELPPAHVRRRDAHAPVRPPRRGHGREDLRHAQDDPRLPRCSTSTPSAAAGGSTTASGCTTGCWSRTTTSPHVPLQTWRRSSPASSRRPRRKTRRGWSRSRSTRSSSSARC